MQYPLNFTFKILALAPQLIITDADGKSIMYIKQKLFKLKEAVNVFTDKTQSQLLYTIKADRVLDFNAKYHFNDAQGNNVGAVGRQGMRSLWRAHYDIYDTNDTQALTIKEEEPWKRLLEGLLASIPIIGFLIILLINPAYIVSRADGTPIFKITKKPAFFEGKFELTQLAETTGEEERQSMLALIMMVLLERRRG